MDFIKKDPVTGNSIVMGTTRIALKNYYKHNFPFNSLNKLFNNAAPEITRKQIFPSTAVAKIVKELGLCHVVIEEELLI